MKRTPRLTKRERFNARLEDEKARRTELVLMPELDFSSYLTEAKRITDKYLTDLMSKPFPKPMEAFSRPNGFQPGKVVYDLETMPLRLRGVRPSFFVHDEIVVELEHELSSTPKKNACAEATRTAAEVVLPPRPRGRGITEDALSRRLSSHLFGGLLHKLCPDEAREVSQRVDPPAGDKT